MNETQRHRRISAILEVVIAAAPSDREEIIRSECTNDQDLIREIKTLLKQDETDSTILDAPLCLADIVLNQQSDQLGLGGLQIPGFVLKGILGQGMSSIVYHARQEVPDREVAVKVLRPLSCTEHAESRIRAEAHLLARLEHPAIARIYHYGVIESPLHAQPYLVMELASGEPLPSYLEKHELSFQERMKLIVDLCEIFEYAHTQGVIHRDIKPSNIMIHYDAVLESHVPMVIDFGIAKLIHGHPIPIDIQTLHPEAFGTLRYMSPERLEGRSSGDTVTSDIYSLGVLASELLGAYTVHHPWLKQSDSMGANPEVTESISRVLSRMTHSNPMERYTSVTEVVSGLQAAALEKHPKRTGIKARHFMISLACIMLCFYMGSTLYKPTRDSIFIPKRTPYSNGIDAPVNLSGIDQESEQAILKGRFMLIGNRTTSGHLSDAHRMIEKTQEEYPELNLIPENLQIRYLRAKSYTELKSGMLEEATTSFLQAKNRIRLGDNLTNEVAEDWRGIAHGLQSCGDHATARAMYNELISHPKFDRVKWEIWSGTLACSAGLYWINDDITIAEEIFRRIVETAPKPKTTVEYEAFAQHQSSLGVVLMTQNKFEEAEKYFRRGSDQSLVVNDPSDPLVCRMYRNLATNYLLQKKYSSCESIMLSIRGVWGSMPEAWDYEIVEADFLLGSAYLGLNKIDLALKHLSDAQKAGQLIPEFKVRRLLPRIDNALGEALSLSGSLIEGKALLDSSEATLNEMLIEDSPWIRLAVERRERSLLSN